MKYKIIVSLVFFFWLAQGFIHGQVRQYYHKDPKAIIEDQSVQLFNQAYAILDRYPPDSLLVAERKLALFALDGLFHDTRIDSTQAIKQHFNQIVNRIVDSLANPPIEGVRVFKVYNHGFILQSKAATVAIDLVRGSKYKYIIDAQMQRLVDLCDILLVSHRHGDHADFVVAEMFAQQRKNVIVPTGLWENKSDYYIRLRNPAAAVTESIKLNQLGRLGVTVFLGHQGDVLNNMYAITMPEGITVMHTGDQSNKNDLSWIKEIRKDHHIDILLAHCWMPNLKEVLEGINPKLIITGHENELGHSIDHREPYWLTFEKMKAIPVPCIVMAWGERYVYWK